MDSQQYSQIVDPYRYYQANVIAAMDRADMFAQYGDGPSMFTAGGMLAAPGPSMTPFAGSVGLQMPTPTPVWSVWPQQGSEAPVPLLPPITIPVATEPPKKGKRRRQRCRNPESFSSKYQRLMDVTYGTAQYWSIDNGLNCATHESSTDTSTHTRCGVKRKWCREAEVQGQGSEENGGQSGNEEVERAAKQSRQMAADTAASRPSESLNHPVPGCSSEQHGWNSVPSCVEQDWNLEDLELWNSILQPDERPVPAATMDWPLDPFEGWVSDLFLDPCLKSWETPETAHVQDGHGQVPVSQVEGSQESMVEPQIQVQQDSSGNTFDPEELILQQILVELFKNCK
ncbi:uncharacterized protein [Paramormyrops kingsleyae]|uniref:uncharacterized protein isoform X1 n=2 Tax=Paramormyrops kingsleyae TaxID=1676925 RepID=UPI003B9758A6